MLIVGCVASPEKSTKRINLIDESTIALPETENVASKEVSTVKLPASTLDRCEGVKKGDAHFYVCKEKRVQDGETTVKQKAAVLTWKKK